MSQNVKTLQGVAIANVKTVQGVAIANVKTIQGVDNTGGGGPTLIASDDFDSYADLALLENQTNWSQVNDSVVISKPASDGSFFGSNQAMARRTDAGFNGNQRCEVTVQTFGGAFDFICAGVRCQSGADTRYWFQSDGTNWYLVKRNGGSQAVITNSTHSALSNGDKIALEASGSGSSTRLTAQIFTGGSWSNVSGAVSVDPGGTYIDNGTPGVGADGGLSRGDDFFGYNL